MNQNFILKTVLLVIANIFLRWNVNYTFNVPATTCMETNVSDIQNIIPRPEISRYQRSVTPAAVSAEQKMEHLNRMKSLGFETATLVSTVVSSVIYTSTKNVNTVFYLTFGSSTL